MINWEDRIKNLREMGEELDLWASRAEHRQRVVLGSIADDLRKFAHEIEEMLAGGHTVSTHSENWQEELQDAINEENSSRPE